MIKFAQETTLEEQRKEDNESQATQTQVQQLVDQINIDAKPVTQTIDRIVRFLRFLSVDPEYASPENFKKVQMFIMKLQDFGEYVSGHATTAEQRIGPLEMPPTPSEDNSAATANYSQIEAQMSVLRSKLNTLIPRMKQVKALIEQAQNRREPWAEGVQFETKRLSCDNAIMVAQDLGLTKVTASIKRKAYPQTFNYRPTPPPIDRKKWKELATQITAFKRAYPTYTFPQVLYHFTKDWNMFDRYKFKKWYNWTQRTATMTNKQNKFAQSQDFVLQDRTQKFDKKKKLLMSRIGLVRKALMDLVNNGLVDNSSSNKIYKILAMLEFEAMGLHIPQIVAARVRRSGKQLKKLGFTEGSSILFTTAKELINRPEAMVKTAKEEVNSGQVSELLRKIKSEMDKLNYSRHLDALYGIKRDLDKLGRGSDSESILRIIRDDLDALDKLNKKLTDVYTSLSRVPFELTEEQDESLPNPKDMNEEPTVEVEDIDNMMKEPKRSLAPRSMPQREQAPTPSRAQTPQPIQTERIPNV